MASYFIAPPDQTDWSMAHEELEARLRERWPHAEVRPEGSPMAFHFTIDARAALGAVDHAGPAGALLGGIDPEEPRRAGLLKP
jgi:hypothetical protein